jgi:hypothetical protein
VAATSGRAGGVHAVRVPAKQRAHLAALLIALCAFAAPLHAQSEPDIKFDQNITQAEFEEFSRLVAQGIFATPVEPARARGLFGFDIGVAVTAIPVDTAATYWTKSTGNDFTVSDYVGVPRLVASKGFAVATISGSYAKVPDADLKIWGGSVDVPVISGGLLSPTLAVRGSYSVRQGSENFDLKTYGVELFLSKGFGPLTPYGAVGRARSNATGHVPYLEGTTIDFKDQHDTNRYTVGLKISMLIPKIVVEATQAEERSYAAKVSFGF